MDKELIKKYISILNLIIERETIYPEPKDSELNDSNGPWDIDNVIFNLKPQQFMDFLWRLEDMKILKTQSGSYIPEFAGEDKRVAYDEDGKIINSDEFIIFYKKTNLKKALKYKQEIEELLTPEEVNEIKNISKISREPILIESGSLNLRQSGVICYENNIIDMRTGLKTLCELFINRPNQLINRNDILDELGVSSKRTKATIAKYVSELNIIIEPYFKRLPIINHKKEGWIFHP